MNRPPPPQQQAPQSRTAPAPSQARAGQSEAAPASTAARTAAVSAGSSPAGLQNLWMEPVPAAHSDASLHFAWQPRQLSSNCTWGCVITTDEGHALRVTLSQPPYEKKLQGEGSVTLQAIPVAAPGTPGTLTARDDVTGAAAEFSWTWRQTQNGRPANPAKLSPGKIAAKAVVSSKQAQARQAAAQSSALPATKAAVAAKAFFGLSVSGQRVAFILDMSGSMRGERWDTCSAQLAAALAGLTPEQEFFVVLYSTRLVEPPRQKGWMHASPEQIAAVLQWLGAIAPEGGTDPKPAFVRVFRLPARADVIYFLTDGAFSGFSAEDCARMQRGGGGSRLGAALTTVGRWFSPSAQPADAEPSHTVINTVTLDDGSSAPVLQEIATTSGGQYIHTSST